MMEACDRVRSTKQHQYEKLLDSEEDEQTSPRQQRYFARSARILSLVNVLFLALNLAATTALFSRDIRYTYPLMNIAYVAPAEAAGVVREQIVEWDLTLGKKSDFTAGNTPEVDALWHSITAPPGDVGFIVVQKDELEKINDTSTPFADGSGYLVTVDVFHQLHCLNHLRQYIFNPIFKKEEDADELGEEHLVHCIDSLRLSLQCHADTSLLTFKWIEGYSLPWPDFRTRHQCRNFDDILEWGRQRMVNVDEPGTFVHPKLGPAGYGRHQENPMANGKKVVYLETP